MLFYSTSLFTRSHLRSLSKYGNSETKKGIASVNCLTIPPLFTHSWCEANARATAVPLLLDWAKRSNTYPFSSSSSACFLFPFYKLHCIHLVLLSYLHICVRSASCFVCIMWCMIYVYTFLLLYYTAAFCVLRTRLAPAVASSKEIEIVQRRMIRHICKF